MKTKILTVLLIIILIIAAIIGGYFLLYPQTNEIIITERTEEERTNYELGEVEVNSELEEMIDETLDGQEKRFRNEIDNYINSIYMGVYSQIGEFNDINSADEKWLWECAYGNLVNLDDVSNKRIVTKDDVEKSAKQIFGNGLVKEFPKEGLEFWLEPEEDGYFYAAASVEYDFYNEYEILSYEKNDDEVIVKLVEYKYNDIYLGDPTELNLYKQNSDKIIKKYPINYSSNMRESYNEYAIHLEDEAKEFVKENVDLFSTATMVLEYDELINSFYIKSFERQ